LRASDWVSAVHNEVDAYVVQDGVAAALGWLEGPLVRHWKSGGATRSGPFSHVPLDPAGRIWPLLGVEAEVALRLGRDVSPEVARTMTPETAGDWVDAMAVSVELVALRGAEGLAASELLRMVDRYRAQVANHRQFQPNGVAADFLQALIAECGEVAGAQARQRAQGQRALLPGPDAVDFLLRGALVLRLFFQIALQRLFERGALAFCTVNEYAPVHLGLDDRDPLFGVDTRLESLALAGVALLSHDGLKLKWASLGDSCH